MDNDIVLCFASFTATAGGDEHEKVIADYALLIDPWRSAHHTYILLDS